MFGLLAVIKGKWSLWAVKGKATRIPWKPGGGFRPLTRMLTFLSPSQATRVRSSATETRYDSSWRPERGFWDETTGPRRRTGERPAFRGRQTNFTLFSPISTFQLLRMHALHTFCPSGCTRCAASQAWGEAPAADLPRTKRAHSSAVTSLPVSPRRCRPKRWESLRKGRKKPAVPTHAGSSGRSLTDNLWRLYFIYCTRAVHSEYTICTNHCGTSKQSCFYLC